MKKGALVFLALSITILASSQTVVFHENFELPSQADSLTSTSTGTNSWGINTTFHAGGLRSDSCIVSQGDTNYLTSNAFSTIGNANVILEFTHICKIEFFDAAEIFVSANNGTTWTKLISTQYLGNANFGSAGNKFTSTAYTRLEKNGAVIVIMTRWHMDDLVGRLLERKIEGEEWDLITFPALSDDGKALWPEKYPVEELAKTKAMVGPYDWAALYQQNPVLTENQEFRQEWIKYRDIEKVDELMTRNFLTIDTAISKRAEADYTGICRNYVDRENNWNLWAYRAKLDPKELIDLLFKLHEEDNYEKIGIEKTIYLDAIKPFLDDEMRKRGKFLPIEPLMHQQINKEVRVRGLIPRYSSKSVYHLTNRCNDLEEEMWQFPRGLHDDVIDATAYQIQLAEAPMTFADESMVQMNREEYGYKE